MWFMVKSAMFILKLHYIKVKGTLYFSPEHFIAKSNLIVFFVFFSSSELNACASEFYRSIVVRCPCVCKLFYILDYLSTTNQ